MVVKEATEIGHQLKKQIHQINHTQEDIAYEEMDIQTQQAHWTDSLRRIDRVIATKAEEDGITSKFIEQKSRECCTESEVPAISRQNNIESEKRQKVDFGKFYPKPTNSLY